MKKSTLEQHRVKNIDSDSVSVGGYRNEVHLNIRNGGLVEQRIAFSVDEAVTLLRRLAFELSDAVEAERAILTYETEQRVRQEYESRAAGEPLPPRP